MPKTVEIKVFKIGQTMPDIDQINNWLDHMGVSDEYELPSDEDCKESELVAALAAKRCYMSFEPGLNPNVTKVRENFGEYFDNILASRHGAVLEHVSYNFAIEGVSRVFTAEMNRHRAGWAISEGSMRFIRFDKDIPYWVPDSLAFSESDDDDLKGRKFETQAIFSQVFAYVEEKYKELLDIWDMNESDKNFAYKKKVTSCLRRIVPMGVATGGVWTGNIRALRHVLTMRCSPAAEEEILHVFSGIAAMMSIEHPQVFGDFEKSPEGFWAPRHLWV